MVAKIRDSSNKACELEKGSSSSTVSQRSSYCGSSHNGSRLVSITVRKEDPDAKAGIQLEQDSTGTVRVTNIAKNGLFGDTQLEIGDVVLSVNKKRLSEGEGPDVLLSVVHKCKSISIAVRKPPKEGAPLKTKNSKKKQDPAKDNNHSKVDTYYMGTVKYNEDGSLKVKGNGIEDDDDVSDEDDDDDDDSQKQDKHTTTISVQKTNPLPENSLRSVVTKRAKKHQSDSTGLILGARNKNELVVKTILRGSPFRGTKLRVGDRILSINDMSFRRHVDAEYAVSILELARLVVTLVVEHGDDYNSNDEGDYDSSECSSNEFGTSSEFGDLKMETDFLIETYHPVTIVGPKTCMSEQAGLQFKRVRTTRPFVDEDNCVPKHKQKRRGQRRKTTWVYVDKIEKDSIFAGTSLAVGDKVLSIDNVDIRSRPEPTLALQTCCASTETVTMVVLKDKKVFKEKGFCFDKSTSDLDWEL